MPRVSDEDQVLAIEGGHVVNVVSADPIPISSKNAVLGKVFPIDLRPNQRLEGSLVEASFLIINLWPFSIPRDWFPFGKHRMPFVNAHQASLQIPSPLY